MFSISIGLIGSGWIGFMRDKNTLAWAVRIVRSLKPTRVSVIKLLRRLENSSHIGRESGARPLLFLVAKTMMTYFGVDDYKTVTLFVKILLANHLLIFIFLFTKQFKKLAYACGTCVREAVE